jgi:Arc/MetJ family transcription regulator
MRVAITIDDALIAKAKEYTGIITTTELLHQALKSLIARKAAQRLSLLGGSEPDAQYIPRRRSPLPTR